MFRAGTQSAPGSAGSAAQAVRPSSPRRIFLLAALTTVWATGTNAQSPSQVLYGLNFSPYLSGQDPNLNSQITLAQITARMQICAPYTRWIRSFSSTNGQESIPGVARQMGLKVAANAWIAEIDNLVAAAHAGQIDIAIVGTGKTPVMGDWNGDGKTKAGAFINGYCYVDYAGSGAFDGASTDRIYAFGAAGDIPVLGRW